MSREIRRVPKDWEHPKENGKYVPMSEYDEKHICDCEYCSVNENAIPKGDWYQLYEGVSEGTPLSPAFSTKEELINWLKNNKDYWDKQWTENQARKIVELGYSPSGIMTGGKFYNSMEALDIKD
jgi:hypothetical protein